MKFLAVYLMLIACVLGAHNNLPTIIGMVIYDLDSNDDGIIMQDELDRFLVLFDSNKDGQLLRNEFVHEWTQRYKDNHFDTERFFDNIDQDKNGMLEQVDIAANLFEMDKDGDGVITVAEFTDFMNDKHPCGHADTSCSVQQVS